MRSEHGRGSHSAGFTLVELLVTLLIISVLIAAVYPVVIRQIENWGALRAARDLTNIRTAVLEFHADVRNHPMKISQLLIQIADTDTPLWARSGNTTVYTDDEVGRWNGPYIDEMPQFETQDTLAYRSGLDIQIQNQLFCVDPSADPVNIGTCEQGDWVGVYIPNTRSAVFDAVNELIDPSESGMDDEETRSRGRLRFLGPPSVSGASQPGVIIYMPMPYLID